eukprot:scaffold19_cov169-Amphora_coffeaeformis.AAC.13
MHSHQLAIAVLSLERPKRPRTAYNYFFHDERQKLLATLPSTGKPKKSGTHGKIRFGELARTISAKWKVITADQMVHYAGLANIDKMHYREQMDAYKQKLRELKDQEEAAAAEPASATNHNEEPPQDIQADYTYGNNHHGVPNHLLHCLKPVPMNQTVAVDNQHLYSFPYLEPVLMRSNHNHDSYFCNTSSNENSCIAELASTLDKQSIEFLVRIFK